MAKQNRSGLGRVIVGLILFAVAFAYVEAAVVVYLRAVYEPLREQLNPDQVPGELLPLMPFQQFKAQGPRYVNLLRTELGRELATLVLLAGAASLVARNFNEWIAAFIVSFGIWDIFYYVFLKLLIDWPASLLTWDVLFLLPVVWVGPVIAPVLVAAAMTLCGLLLLWRERSDRPVAFTPWHWVAIVAGGLIIAISFAGDFRHVMAGGAPHPFPWSTYLGGLLLGVGAFVHAWARLPAGAAGESENASK